MKFLNKIIKGIDSLVSTITISILVTLMAFGTYALYDVYDVYNSALLADDIITLKPQSEDPSFDFSNLKKINKEIVGWITLNDTKIDYPILKSNDNTKYLNTDYHDEYSTTGSIFLDYRNDNFLDDYSIIYGHNMNANLMFGDIKSYKDESFFNYHLDGILYTETKRYKLTIMAYAMISAYDTTVYDLYSFKNARNFEVIHYFDNIATFKKDLEINDEKIILLSTCDSSGINERSVLIAKLKELGEDEVINIKPQTADKKFSPLDILKPDKDSEKESWIDFDIFQNINIWTIVLFILSIVVLSIYVILFMKKYKLKKKRKK